MDCLYVEFDPQNPPVSWHVDDSWTFADLIKDISNQLGMRDNINIALYGSRLEPNMVIGTSILETDIIQIRDKDMKPLTIRKEIFDSIDKLQPDQYRIFYTESFTSITKGFVISLSDKILKQDYRETIKFIRSEIQKHSDIEEYAIIVKLPSGIIYREGSLFEFFDAYPQAKHHIYVDLVNTDNYEVDIGDILTEEIDEICDTTDLLKTSFSPMKELDDIEYEYAAVVYGLLSNSNSDIIDKIISWCEIFTRYSPALVGLYDIKNKLSIKYHQIVSISNVLITIIHDIFGQNDMTVWSHVLMLFNYIESQNMQFTNKFKIYYAPFIRDKSKSYFLNHYDTLNHLTTYNLDFTDQYLLSNSKLFLPTSGDLQKAKEMTFQVFSVIDLNEKGRVCIFKTDDGMNLYLKPKYDKSSKDFEKIALIINPRTGSQEEIDIAKTASIQNSENKGHSRNEVKQINIICCDLSRSMENSNKLKNAKKVISILAKNVFEFGIGTMWGLINFSSTVKTVLPLTAIASEFSMAVNEDSELGDDTKLFEAIKVASETITSKSEYFDNVYKRIVVVTDGIDNDNHYKSDESLQKLTKILTDNKIILDVIFIDESDSRAAVMSQATGGLAFFFKGSEQNLMESVFSSDGFYDLSLRKYGKVTVPDKYSIDFKNFATGVNLRDSEISSNEEVLTLEQAISRIDKKEKELEKNFEKLSSTLFAIRQQMKDICCQKEFIDWVDVFVNKNDFSHWNIFLKTEENSIYEEKWFKLSLHFVDSYPLSAPQLRFIHQIPHPNVSLDGTIQLKKLRGGYDSTITVFSILRSLRNMLTSPVIPNCINNVVRKCMNDKGKLNWTRISLIYNDYVYYETREEFMNEIKLSNENVKVDIGRIITFDEDLEDPFTHRLIELPVRAPNGRYFDMNILQFQIKKSENAHIVDPRTGEIIDFSNLSLMKLDQPCQLRIGEYKQHYHLH
ncbi:Ubiquitin-conjugating enzyme family protein [Trichomonas vaginalis G3]|uniref:Ubiquitin-conjugating enzyme family protein n=1 Tax=Trichomonas vaginalis (strain ATCC PRA-98 / G3) TaxID=412133 RepID=A2FDU2_TRIV3|nr:histone ubiquitination [Trichomonas vaginalis G3]EAX96941.1 Ubiquitin-conjugating enzyme family protein [Trichomonas vaginalis G3]KAI5532613.1 histone ubiquitination [Trichomonas vaginalis G3]|eukprot:XP_001309871.1 Ubiquitin-conjugating enzyme family protein [Trichomonas vaginalis G3]